MATERCHYIAGSWVPGSGLEFSSLNPASDQEVWRGREATIHEVDRAVAAARGALEGWTGLSLERRAEKLGAYQQALARERAPMAALISTETGKPLWEAATEVEAMIAKLDISIAAHGDRCREVQGAWQGATSVTRFRPTGAVAVFGPFNLPGHLPGGHILPALLAGCTVVFKPSEFTPAVGLKMAEFFEAADLPPGVFNLVQGGRGAGMALSVNPGLDGIFFTGSVEAGCAIHRAAAGHPQKLLALEMGGNNPLVVDAENVEDLRAAAALTVSSAFLTAGQRCVCARRLIVPTGKRGDAFVAELVAILGRLRVGLPEDRPEPFMGPLIRAEAAKKVRAAQEELLNRGATRIVELKTSDRCRNLLLPGVLDVTSVEARPDREIFGPLLQLVRVQGFAAALSEANNTAYGLAAGLLSDRREHFDLFLRHVRAGIVNWNRPLTGASSRAPFGGLGRSGNQRPSAYFASDYCAHPVASLEAERVQLPSALPPGLELG